MRVRFVEGRFEGREEWVPAGRLKVRWEGIEDWLTAEARWSALRRASAQVRDTPAYWAIDVVFDHSPAGQWATPGSDRDSGLLFIRDLPRLATELDLDPATVTGDPLTLTDADGTLVGPWRLAEQVARAAARRYPDVLLDRIELEEVQARRDAIHGRSYPGRGRRAGGYLDPETCAATDRQFQAARDLVRGWCGAEATDRRRELAALRVEVGRLGDLVERAAGQLRQAGLAHQAATLERELGVRVETIRRREGRHR